MVRGSMRGACEVCALEENESHSYTYWHVVSMCVCVGGGCKAKLQKHQAQTYCCLNILPKCTLKKCVSKTKKL